MAHTATITYAAYEDAPVTITFEVDEDDLDVTDPNQRRDFAETIFSQTNHYAGGYWDAMKPELDRTGANGTRRHTALSVGDMVSIGGHTYRCAPLGWDSVR